MNVTMAESLNRALHDAMADDPRVLVLGEDVGALGGVFRITQDLQRKFGEERCFDTPLAESAILGTSLGLAMAGWRPVPEIQFDGFSYPGFEQLISHIAKYHNRTRGLVRLPITVRIPFGGGIGGAEHHSESPETHFVHVGGLKVVVPSTAADAYSLLRQSIRCDDPVVFLEPKARYWSKHDVELPHEGEPIGRAAVRCQGEHVTVVSYGPTVALAIEAAKAAEDLGWSLEVIDLRSLVPLDEETVLTSVRKTGRAIVVHEAAATLGFGAELAALIQQFAFYHLESPVLRVTGFDTPYPPAKLERYWLPNVDRLLDAVEQSLAY